MASWLQATPDTVEPTGGSLPGMFWRLIFIILRSWNWAETETLVSSYLEQ